MVGDPVLGQNGRSLSSFNQDGSTGGTKQSYLKSAHDSLWALLNEPFWKGCLAPGDTSKEPVETWGMQVSSTDFKGLWEPPEFLRLKCVLYLAVLKLAESDPWQTHWVCGSWPCKDWVLPFKCNLSWKVQIGGDLWFSGFFLIFRPPPHLLPCHMCVPAQQLSLYLP